MALFRSAYNPATQTSIGFSLKQELLEELYPLLDAEIKIKRLLKEDTNTKNLAILALLFGESNASVLISAHTEKEELLRTLATKIKLPLIPIGETNNHNTFQFALF